MASDNMVERDPKSVQAWLIGSGIASLTAALHLIHDAKVPGSNIHILDVHDGSGGGMAAQGDAENGYFLPYECSPHFHGEGLEELLGLIPATDTGERSIMDFIREREEREKKEEEKEGRDENVLAQFVKKGESGQPETFHPHGIQIGMKHRMALIRLMLEDESGIGRKSIEEGFDETFFETTFWRLWASTFNLQPCHSASEFHRHLRKYLEEIRSLHSLRTLHRTEYNLIESVIVPLTAHLKQQGVDFRFHHTVTDLHVYPDSTDPTTISEIEVRTEHDTTELITLDPVDIILVTVGSTSSGAVLGTNTSAPQSLTANWEDLMEGDWKLWEKLAVKAPKFGNPTNFLPRIQQALVETFTTTLSGAGAEAFQTLYRTLTNEQGTGGGGRLSILQCPWDVTITIPHQPVFAVQPANTMVILGYALSPTRVGAHVKKEMWQCTGAEILTEVLCHLGLDESKDSDDTQKATILANAKTIPCGLPLGTSPFLTRAAGDRPSVIPECTTNVACVGQFANVPSDTTLEVEYSVRGAEMAVRKLMGLPEKRRSTRRSVLLEIFDLLI